jgi:hypothetical protein
LDLNEPECEPSRSVKPIHTPEPSSENTGRESPATQTLESSPPTASEQTAFPWMSFVEGSPARISARPALEQVLMANAAACGSSTPDLLASFDPNTSSWRTSQRCLVEDWTEFSEAWPRSGTMRNGIAYRLPPLARLTDATEYGLWPTPTLVYTRTDRTVEEIETRQAEVKAATLAKGKHNTGNGFGLNLAQAVRFWPTPNAGDYKAGMSNAPGRQQSSLPRSVGIVEGVSSGRRGGLNPTWVEWLMGFPLQWTVLKDWVTPSSRRSRKSSAGQS